MDRLLEWIANRLAVIAGALFGALFVANVANIVARYLFAVSYIWIPDLSRIFFIWMVFLGGTAAYIRRQHLMIDFVKARLPGRLGAATELVTTGALAGLFGVMIVKGIRITAVRMNIPYDAWDAVPTAVSYAAVPVAGTLMLLAAVSRLRRLVRRPRDPASGP